MEINIEAQRWRRCGSRRRARRWRGRCLIIVTGRQHTRKWQNGQAEQTVLQQSAPDWIGCHDFFQALPGNGYMRLRDAAARVIGKMRNRENDPSQVIMTLRTSSRGFQSMAGRSDTTT